jgi:hypothetical protein
MEAMMKKIEKKYTTLSKQLQILKLNLVFNHIIKRKAQFNNVKMEL